MSSAVNHPARSRLALAALTLVVVLAHGALLGAVPLSFGLHATSAPELTRSFTTRSVASEPLVPLRKTAATRPRPAAAQSTAPSAAMLSVESAAPVSLAPETIAPPAPATEVAQTPEPTPAEPLAAAGPTTPAPEAVPPETSLPTVPTDALPGSVRLKYVLKSSKLPFSANAELSWQQNARSYDARVELSLFGLTRVQTSRGEIGPNGLEPVRFSDKFRSELAAHFNHEQGKVTFSANTPDAVLLPGAQDRLSVMIQLAALIASAPERYPELTTIAIQTIGPRDAAPWIFTVRARETLDLPGGTQETIRLVRNPRREFDQKVELWLAPALGYLPARIRITEHNGEYVDQQWLATEPLS